MKIRRYLIKEDMTSPIHKEAVNFARKIKAITEKDSEHKENEINGVLNGIKTYLSGLHHSQIEDFHRAFREACGKDLKDNKIVLQAGGIINGIKGKKAPEGKEDVKKDNTSNKEIKGKEAPEKNVKKVVSKKDVKKNDTSKKEQEDETNKDEIDINLSKDDGTEDVIISGKDKTIYKVDTLNTETFKNDIDIPPQHEFEMSMMDYKGSDLKTENTFKSPDYIKNHAKFPRKYDDLLTRFANTKLFNKDGTEPPITSFISKGGAGKIQAQSGEIMTLMFTTMTDDEVDAYSNSLLEHIKKEKGNDKLIITKEWVEAALNNRKAIHNMLKTQYKNINIPDDIVASSWDTKEDVESLGMNNYEVNKGFSTDVYFKVKDPKGGYRLEEISLKKDKNVNFLNSGTGRFREWDESLKDEIDPIKYSTNQKKKLIESATKLKDEINKSLEEEGDNELKKLIGNNKIDDLLGASNRHKKKILLHSLEILSKTNDEAKKLYDDIVNDSKEYEKNAINEISSNEKLRNGMLSEISKEFPLKAVSSGEEKMAIGDMAVNKEVMKQIFGTDKWDEIKDKLVVVGGDKPYIAYKADVMGKEIPIAEVKVREDGVGYGGQFKFEMKLDSRFAKDLKKANDEIYKSSNDISKKDKKEKSNKIKDNFIYNILQKRINILLEKYLEE